MHAEARKSPFGYKYSIPLISMCMNTAYNNQGYQNCVVPRIEIYHITNPAGFAHKLPFSSLLALKYSKQWKREEIIQNLKYVRIQIFGLTVLDNLLI